ncbi:MAG: outer membrane beta-barrel protein [Alphaproteobacteria bacterium]
MAFRAPSRSAACRIVVAAAMLAPGPLAWAQTAAEDTVRSRYPPPEYKPLGVDIGYGETLLLFPKAQISVSHTDNLFRDGADRVADQIVTFAPSLDLKSDWDNHVLEAGVRAEIGNHIDNPDEDYVDASARLRTRIDVSEDDKLDIETLASRRHEDRSSRDDTNEREPTIFHVVSGKLTAEHQGGAVLLRLSGLVERQDYEDNGLIDNDDRDRLQSEIRLRAGYEIVEAAQPFIEVAANRRDFDVVIDNDGIRRGSEGYEVLAGNTVDLSGVTFLEGAVGYRVQTFDEPSFADVTGPTFKGRAVWNATDLLTLTLRLDRRIDETTIADSAAVTVTEASLAADYAPLEHLLATARVGFGNDDFEGSGDVDQRWRVDLGIEYLIGSNFVVGASYSHDRRSTSDETGDFIANDFVFRFTSQL